MDEKKIHTTLPLIFFTIIQKDIKSFNIPLNNFYNRIYSYINNGKYKDNKITVEMHGEKEKMLDITRDLKIIKAAKESVEKYLEENDWDGEVR